MNSMDKWNVIVEQFNMNKNSQESQIQSLWENIFSQIFGYSKLLGFLDAQKSYQIGNSGSIKPDIMLKNSSGPVCVIELKKEDIALNNKIESQLFSYLKMTKINTGLIISDKIYLYAYEYAKSDSDQASIEITFEKNNKEGELFIELLSQESFKPEAISSFVNEKINHLNNVKSIKSSITKQTVLDALGNYLGNKYTSDEINEALDSFEIIINAKKKENKKIDTLNVIKVKSNESLLEEKTNIGLDGDLIAKGGVSAANYLKTKLVESKIIDYSFESTVAKLNKDGRRFWANPSIEFLKEDWCLILNDVFKKELYIFIIPSNSLSVNVVRTRFHQGKTLIDLQIVHEDDEFVDLNSKIQYNKWYVKTIKY